VGVAKQRKAIVDGLRDSIMDFSGNVPGTTPKDVMDLLLLTQYFGRWVVVVVVVVVIVVVVFVVVVALVVMVVVEGGGGGGEREGGRW